MPSLYLVHGLLEGHPQQERQVGEQDRHHALAAAAVVRLPGLRPLSPGVHEAVVGHHEDHGQEEDEEGPQPREHVQGGDQDLPRSKRVGLGNLHLGRKV